MVNIGVEEREGCPRFSLDDCVGGDVPAQHVVQVGSLAMLKILPERPHWANVKDAVDRGAG